MILLGVNVAWIGRILGRRDNVATELFMNNTTKSIALLLEQWLFSKFQAQFIIVNTFGFRFQYTIRNDPFLFWYNKCTLALYLRCKDLSILFRV